MPSLFRVLLGSLVAVLVAACSAAGASPSSTTPIDPSAGASASASADIAYPTGATDLVVRFRYVGGFAPPVAHLLQLPMVSVYGDGTVIVPGPQIDIYPGPALPNLQQANITPAGMQILLAAARDAGLLGPDGHYDLGGIMDASTAEFVVNADGKVHTVSAYALAESGGREAELPPGTDPAVADARAKLALFQGQLGSLEALLDKEISAWTAHEPVAVQLIVSPGAPAAEQGLAQEPIAWPLAMSLDRFGEELPFLQGQRCGVVMGAELATLMPLLAGANTLTPWTDGEAVYGIAVRPLLPSEGGCPSELQ